MHQSIVTIRDHDHVSKTSTMAHVALSIFNDALRAAGTFGTVISESATYWQAYCNEHDGYLAQMQHDACYVGHIDHSTAEGQS